MVCVCCDIRIEFGYEMKNGMRSTIAIMGWTERKKKRKKKKYTELLNECKHTENKRPNETNQKQNTISYERFLELADYFWLCMNMRFRAFVVEYLRMKLNIVNNRHSTFCLFVWLFLTWFLRFGFFRYANVRANVVKSHRIKWSCIWHDIYGNFCELQNLR